MRWNPPETAPKDREIILNVGLPWPFVGHWNKYTDKWAYAVPQGDESGDVWFENETEKEILGWLPMPEIGEKNDNVPN